MNRVQRVLFLVSGMCFCLVLWTWVAYLSVYVAGEKMSCATPECRKQYEALQAAMIKEKEMFVSPFSDLNGVMLGGVERSGVNLLRTMLNAHPQLDCSHEISLAKWQHQDMTDQKVLYSIAKAIGEEIPETNSQPVCIKADFEYLDVLTKVLPNVKAIVVIRDGRAVAHSMISNVRSAKNFDDALKHWSNSLSVMLSKCYELGSDMCMMMIYEKLVEDTEVWLKATLNFAGLPWSPDVLNHSKIAGDEEYYRK